RCAQLFGVPCFAFPNDEHGPPSHFKGRYVLSVPLLVSGQLWPPIIPVRSGFPPLRTVWVRMQMPEASMHKDHFAARPKYKVGLARKIGAMQPVTVAHSMNKVPDQ